VTADGLDIGLWIFQLSSSLSNYNGIDNGVYVLKLHYLKNIHALNGY
jgi:hypothetical protein